MDKLPGTYAPPHAPEVQSFIVHEVIGQFVGLEFVKKLVPAAATFIVVDPEL